MDDLERYKFQDSKFRYQSLKDNLERDSKFRYQSLKDDLEKF